MPTAADTMFQVPVVRRYLEAVRAQHRYIDARGVMQVVRDVKLAIDDAFVTMRLQIEKPTDRLERVPMMGADGPVLREMEVSWPGDPGHRRHDRGRPSEPQTIAADVLLRHGARWFVLGDPGGGKTTLLRQMAFRAADNALRSEPQSPHLPLFIALRHLGAEWERHPEWSSSDAVFNYLAGAGLDDLIEVNEAERAAWCLALQTALRHSSVLLLCDGLDEQRDAQARQRSNQAIEELLVRHAAPRVPCLITSRAVGFDSGPLRSSFALARLQPFNEQETSEFFRRCSASKSEVIE